MHSEKQKKESEYGFPFLPYDIQRQFMKNLYGVFEKSTMGVFESPTGTGKSLSIICGGLSWLRDYETNHKHLLEEKAAALKKEADRLSEGDDWLSQASKKLSFVESLASVRKELALWEEYEKRIKKLQEEHRKISLALKEETKHRNAFTHTTLAQVFDENEDILTDDITSDPEDEPEEEGGGMKIIFSSRTHSQLSQFVNEVKKWKYSGEIRVVTLASRQQLCINEDVRRLGNNNLINERCLELKRSKPSNITKGEVPQKKLKEAGGCGCPYYKSATISNLATDVLFEVQDIEDVVKKGKELKACPYYASRQAVQDAQLIVVPYNMLFHKQTRESCGIQVKNKVVIVDEAHNILETISSIYSAEVSARQIDEAHSQVAQYLDKYNTRLSPRNLLALRQLIQILKQMSNFVHSEDQQVLLPSEFAVKAGIDNFNLFQILEFLERSQLARKLNSLKTYIPPASLGKVQRPSLKDLLSKDKDGSQSLGNKEKRPAGSQKEVNKNRSKTGSLKEVANKDTQLGVSDVEERRIQGSPILSVVGLLNALCRVHSDGRIVLKKLGKKDESSLKYLLLNPAGEFKDIVSDARSVVVAGGTMRPISEFEDQLFGAAGIPRERIQTFTFGHVISPEQVLPLIVTKGPTGKLFEFSYNNRGDAKMLDELGQLIVNVSNIIPGGIVVFFSSYETEQKIFNHWSKSGHMEKIGLKKQVFREPKKSSEMESVLSSYSKCIASSSKLDASLTGAILLSVVGGKMSEGINFSDDLGRCVIVVGLPYPNLESPELKEKMAFLDRTVPKGGDNRSAGQQFYEALCMKAVNQSIGRAIRHQSDYASILLVDQRYERGNVRSALPDWLANRLQVVSAFGPMVGCLRKFFAANKAANSTT